MDLVQTNDSTIQLIIDGNMYSESLLHKCFYWYGSEYEVEIQAIDDTYIITLTSLKGPLNFEMLQSKIKSDLIDFKTREIIFNETKNIRELIIAKAFSQDNESDMQVLGEISDPVGFDPNSV